MLTHRLRPARLPAALLIALLQRTPLERVLSVAEEWAAGSPPAFLVRGAIAGAVSLGALDSLAGATMVVASPSTPLSCTAGTSTQVVFGVSGSTQNPPSSWRVSSGTIPPGLNFQGLTAPGTVNVVSQYGTAVLSGTPTQAGNFQFTVLAYESPNGTGASTPASTYSVVVSANANSPNFTTQPQSQTVNLGQAVTFTAAASGSPSYQWKLNGTAVANGTANGETISGATSATLTLSAAQLSDAGNYTVVAGNSSGSTTSAPASLTVLNPAAPPVFTTQPFNQTVGIGTNLTMTAVSSGSPSYRWMKNGASLTDGGSVSGSATSTLTFTNVQLSDAGNYWAVATNSSGSSSSTQVVLSVTTIAPYFTQLPSGQTVPSGTTVAFTAIAQGQPAPAYQWYFSSNGGASSTAISGATSSTVLVPSATAANAGLYACVASNAGGSVTSLAASLSFASASSPGRLTNLSILSNIQGMLSMGFVIGGSGTSGSENLLIRATGPALASLGVTGVMPDPTLTVVQQSSSATVAANSGWGTPASNQAAVTAADSALGAFPLTDPSSKDSALVKALPISNGGYSVQIAGATGDSGTALAEVYDDTTAYTAASPRLINLSCLTSIPTGGTLGTGFVVGGSAAKTVLVRASGPALGTLGLSGYLPDPTVSVVQQSNGASVASNAAWAGNSAVATAAGLVGAFPWPNPSSLDSAVVLTLSPGPYTVEVASASGVKGQVLVEIYEVP